MRYLKIDLFILELHANARNLSELLRFFVDELHRFSPKSKVIIMVPKYLTAPLITYFSRVKNVYAVLDNAAPLDTVRSHLMACLQCSDNMASSSSLASPLSPQELNVLDSLLKGVSALDIAKKRRVHYKTVSSQKRSALHKLGLPSLNFLLKKPDSKMRPFS
ncbi:hypothetical protein Z042_08700 [Chania multitudinisentens RB-25]|uniref:HTH luxR-type domain-containing protein n=1 Tax=Chania multitudinisentens RB-25 TaxID=1441930 RepID=W0LK61_9GAMM|nr:hypothetical protein Z042_08700 [Chania multitudinisentens RB-25]